MRLKTLASIGLMLSVLATSSPHASAAGSVPGELHGIRLGETPDDVIATVTSYRNADGTPEFDAPASRATPCSLPASQAYLCESHDPGAATPAPDGWQQDYCYKRGATYVPTMISRKWTGSTNDPKRYAYIGGRDGDLSVTAYFDEDYPAHPCQSFVTRVSISQKMDISHDSLHETEDRFIAAAIAKFGKPDVYEHRHVGPYVNTHQADNIMANLFGGYVSGPTVDQKEYQPVLSWCSGGTTAECSTHGDAAGVDRRLKFYFTETENEWSATTTLSELATIRRDQAAIKRANADANTPHF